MAYTVDTTPTPAGKYSVRDSSGRVVRNANSPEIAQTYAQQLTSREQQMQSAPQPSQPAATVQPAANSSRRVTDAGQNMDVVSDPDFGSPFADPMVNFLSETDQPAETTSNLSDRSIDDVIQSAPQEVFNQSFLTSNLLEARNNRPSVREFREATGLGFREAASLLGVGQMGYSDWRDWDKIMNSSDPAAAASVANGQLFRSGAVWAPYNASPVDPENVVAQSGNFYLARLSDGSVALSMADGSNNKLGSAGITADQIRNNAFTFGLNLNDLQNLLPQAEESNPSLAAGIRKALDMPSLSYDIPDLSDFASYTKNYYEELARTRAQAPQQQAPQTSAQQSATTTTQTTQQPTTTYTPQVTQPQVTQPQVTGFQPAQPQPIGTLPTGALQTSTLSAVPQNIQTKTSYTGTPGAVAPELLRPMGAQQAQSYGVQTVNYVNQFGSTIPVIEVNGQPTTFVPAGYTRQATAAAKGGYMTKGYAEGGSVGDFSPQQSASILAKMFGYRGPADNTSIQQFLAANPAAAARMGKYREAMTKMAGGRTPAEMNRGGVVGYQEGGLSVTQLPDYQSEGPRWQVVDASGNIFYNTADQAAAQTFSTKASNPQENQDWWNQEMGPYVQQGVIADPFASQEPQALTDLQQAQQNLLSQAAQPIRQAVVQPILPQAGQFIPSDAGQTTPLAPFAEAATVGAAQQAQMPTASPAATMQADTVAPQAEAQLEQLQAQTGQVSEEAQVTAAQQNESAVSQLEAATGTAVMMDNPVKREIQAGELISGSAVDATKVEELNAMTQAATATPSQQATVQGQLEGLMQQFEGGETPAWAAGAMRNAQAVLAARGVGASSMAGQAVIQAAMESALPIAQADAATRAQFESQNLSNRQQAAMLAAQQRAQFLQIEFDQEFQSRVQNASRIADVANMNFTAEQQVALENARAANTVNLQNLSNRQAMVMAEAAALANMDVANLNNRQQAAVQNAQNFLQMDMANLSNRQQTEIFKSQQMMQALFTDQAAENAAAQFNASSENQTNQFFAQLQAQTSQFNAAQRNALDQFNAGEVNALREFNSAIQQQRDLFNAQNGLVIAQANAQWRQNIDTLNTAAQNEANMEFARTLNAMSAGTLDQLWQRERDLMSFAFTASESAQDRSLNILLADKELDAYREKMQNDEDTAKWTVIADAALDLFS